MNDWLVASTWAYDPILTWHTRSTFTTASPWTLYRHFCFINSACFHIYLLISCSQSQLQGTYNYFMFEETGSQEEKVEASVYLSTVSDPSKNNSCWSSPHEHQAFETHPGFLLTERMQVPWLSSWPGFKACFSDRRNQGNNEACCRTALTKKAVMWALNVGCTSIFIFPWLSSF